MTNEEIEAGLRRYEEAAPGPENVSADCRGMCAALPEALKELREERELSASYRKTCEETTQRQIAQMNRADRAEINLALARQLHTKEIAAKEAELREARAEIERLRKALEVTRDLSPSILTGNQGGYAGDRVDIKLINQISTSALSPASPAEKT